MTQKVLVTGAAGNLARQLLNWVDPENMTVTTFDRHDSTHAAAQRSLVGELHDETALAAGVFEQDAVLHLAGIPLEDEWPQLLHANIDGTYRLLEAARQAGVKRVVLASSIHSVGFTPVPTDGKKLTEDIPILPDTLYGVSKAAVEALGGYFHARYGMEVVCLRIASRQPEPSSRRTLHSWLSPQDTYMLVRSALTHSIDGIQTVWGVSANKSSYFDPAAGERIGYRPVDDSEPWREEILAVPASEDPSAPWLHLLGGEFCSSYPPSMEKNQHQIFTPSQSILQEGK